MTIASLSRDQGKTAMTDLRSPFPAGNGFREFGGPRLCRYRRRSPERSAGQCACSPTLYCDVSFQGPRRSALWWGLWDPAGRPVRVKTAVGTFAWSAFYENAAKLKA